MRIITFKTIKNYLEKDNYAAVALYDWYHKVKKAKWTNLLDVKKDPVLLQVLY